MRAFSTQNKDNFISLNIHVEALKHLLNSKALYVEDVHCPDNASKRQLRQLLMQLVMSTHST
ncbi:hypothetical protein KIH87_00185 [Paraneptunicella aestuarii]|uniref:hypothetical protein n=1 Tax=Paraneptunicella aestuarii TaxID=2831148 RepID=UPI001E5D83BB|nr:hypothetical protein [Paraneptunicella aestuarii]UAA38833.1 hypothetical protein KIH87_00185 [Paraneptunicella aestuarii]